jgi:hypothetical protein
VTTDRGNDEQVKHAELLKNGKTFTVFLVATAEGDDYVELTSISLTMDSIDMHAKSSTHR